MMSEGSDLPVQPIFVGMISSPVFNAIPCYAEAYRVCFTGTVLVKLAAAARIYIKHIDGTYISYSQECDGLLSPFSYVSA